MKNLQAKAEKAIELLLHYRDFAPANQVERLRRSIIEETDGAIDELRAAVASAAVAGELVEDLAALMTDPRVLFGGDGSTCDTCGMAVQCDGEHGEDPEGGHSWWRCCECCPGGPADARIDLPESIRDRIAAAAGVRR